MARSWIVTANGGRAFIYSQNSLTSTPEPLTRLFNADASSLAAETESDRLGQHSASSSRHSVGAPTQPSGYEPAQTPSEHHIELLARRLADFLLKGFHANSFDRIYLFASAEFLGVLRKVMDPNVKSQLALELDKDYTQLSPAQLRDLMVEKAAA